MKYEIRNRNQVIVFAHDNLNDIYNKLIDGVQHNGQFPNFYTIYEDGQKWSQKKMILEYLKLGYRLDKWKATKLNNCMVLAQRIADINEDIASGLITGFGDRVQTVTDAEHAGASVYWLDRERVGYIQEEFQFTEANC